MVSNRTPPKCSPPNVITPLGDYHKPMFWNCILSNAYNAKIAKRRANAALPNATPLLEAAPVTWSGPDGLAVAFAVPLETATVAMVDGAAPAAFEAAAVAAAAVVTAETAGGVPTTSAGPTAVAVPELAVAAGVEKTT